MERPVLSRSPSDEEFSIIPLPSESSMNGQHWDNEHHFKQSPVHSVNGTRKEPLDNETVRFPGMADSQLSNPLQEQLELQLKLNNGLRDDLFKNNSLLRQQLASLKNFQDQSLKSREHLRNSIETLQRDRQKLLQEKDVLLQEKQDFEQQVKSQYMCHSKAQQELAIIRQKCSEYENQIAKMQEELKRAEVTVLTVTSQLREMETEYKLEKDKYANEKEALVEQLEKQKLAFQDQLSSAQQFHMNFESELAPLKAELELNRMEAARLKDQNEKLGNQNEALVEQLNKQAAHWNEEKCVLEQKCSSLEQREHHTSHFNAIFDDTQREITNLKRQNEVLGQEKFEILEQLKVLGLAAGVNSFSDEYEMGFSVVNNTADMIQHVSKALMDKLEQEELITEDLKRIMKQQREQIADYEKKLREADALTKLRESEVAKRFIMHQDPSPSMKSASNCLQDYEERCQSIGQQLGACQERLESLKGEDNSSVLIQGLQKEIGDLHLLLEQEKHEKLYDRQILEERVEQLSREYRQIIASWEIYEQEQLSKSRQSDALTAIANRQHQEKMDELTAKVMNLEEEKQAVTNELSRLKGQIDLLQRDSEQIPILRAQVEVYQQDFEKERVARLKAESLLDSTKQEINILQVQVSQLQDELSRQEQNEWLEIRGPPETPSAPQQHQPSPQPQESLPREPPPPVEVFRIPRSPNVRVLPYEPDPDELDTGHRRRRSHRGQQSPRTRRSQGSTSEEPLVPMTYECPKCCMAYTSVEAVQNHIDGCLRENDGPYP